MSEIVKESEEQDEEASHSVGPIVWLAIVLCFAAIAYLLNSMYDASVGLRKARLHQEIEQIIASSEQLDTLLRSARYSELIEPSSQRSENAVAVLRLIYDKRYSRALRKTQVRSYTKLEAASDLSEVLQELIDLSEELRRPVTIEQPAPAAPEADAAASTAPAETGAEAPDGGEAPQEIPSLTAQAKQAEERKQIESNLASLHEEAVGLAREAVLELARPSLSQKQVNSYNHLRGFMAKWGYKLPSLP